MAATGVGRGQGFDPAEGVVGQAGVGAAGKEPVARVVAVGLGLVGGRVQDRAGPACCAGPGELAEPVAVGVVAVAPGGAHRGAGGGDGGVSFTSAIRPSWS